MGRLQCPRCATVVEAAPGASPVCPRCGFGAPALAPAAPPAAAPPAGVLPAPGAQPRAATPAAAPYPYPPYPPAQAYPGTPQYPSPYGAYHPQGRTDGMAIASLVMGCLGWLSLLGLVLDVLAIVFGIMALNRMKADPSLRGKGMAITGIVLGSVFLVVIGLAAVVFVLVSRLARGV